MKNLQKGFLLYLALITMPVIGYSQILISQFEKYDLRVGSAQAFSYVRNELNSSANDSAEFRSRKNHFDSLFYSDSSIYQRYERNYNIAMDKARKDVYGNDILYNLDKKMVNDYCIDEIKNLYNTSPNPNVDQFYGPLMKRRAFAFTIQRIDSNIYINRDAISKLSIILLNYIGTLQKDVNAATSALTEADIKKYVEDLLNSTIENNNASIAYQLFTRSIDSIANKAYQLYNTGKAVTDSISNVGIDLKANFQNEFRSLTDSVSHGLKNDYEQVTDTLDAFAKNEIDNSAFVKELANSVKQNNERLRTLSDSIYFFANKPAVNVNIIIVNDLQTKFSKLSNENLVKTEIIDKYLDKTIYYTNTVTDITQKIEQVFDGTKQDELKQTFENLQKPTLSSVVSLTNDGINLAATVLKIDPKVVEFANTAVKGIAVAKTVIGVLTCFTPMGFVTALSGISDLLGGLFGGGGPSQEIAEIQKLQDSMQKNFKEVNVRLDSIDKKLDKISSQIESVNTSVKDLHADMLKNFRLLTDTLNQRFDRLDRNDEVIVSLLQKNNFKLFNTCKNFSKYNFQYVKTLDELGAFYDNDLFPLGDDIKELPRLLNIDNMDFFSIRFTDNLKNSYNYIYNKYNPVLKIFIDSYSDSNTIVSEDKIRLLLLFTEKIDNYSYVKDIFNSADRRFFTNTSMYLNLPDSENYLSYKNVNSFSSLLINYSPFFELHKKHANGYEPDSLKEFLNAYSTLKRNPSTRKDVIIDNLLFLDTLVSLSMVQQSLLSGSLILPRMKAILFLSDKWGQEQINNVIDALNANKILAQNFATELIYDDIFYDPKTSKSTYDLFQKYYDHFMTDSLTNLLKERHTDCKFDTAGKKIVLRLKVNNIELPVADPSIIYADKMIYSDGVYTLLKTKQLIKNKLMDLKFTDYLPSDSSSLYFKYLPVSPN